jgi:hypothetical protein
MSESEFIEDQGPSWDNTYLLAWYDREGKAYLTTWSGDLHIVHVVVTGCRAMEMPIWDAPVPGNAKLHSIPAGVDPQEHARALGGYHAFGWHVPVKRKEPAP